MLICNNCNKQYKEELCFCPDCGYALVEGIENVTFEKEPSNDVLLNSEVIRIDKEVIDDVEHNNFSSTNDFINASMVSETKANNEKLCLSCRTKIEEGERFCLKCGMPVGILIGKVKEVETDIEITNEGSSLQNELLCAFKSNKFFEFILKYAVVIAIYFPVSLLIGKIETLESLYQLLDYTVTVGFYGYCISLIALYASKNYLPILIAITLRFVNSFINMFQSDDPFTSFERIIILFIVFMFVFKKYSRTGQYQTIKSKFTYDTKTCSSCGAITSNDDTFCPKCGNKIGG